MSQFATLSAQEGTHTHAAQEEPVDSDAHVGSVMPAVDLEQLQLIELCFGEHEFGVVLDSDNNTVHDTEGECISAGANYVNASDDAEQMDFEHYNEPGETMLAAFEFDPVQFVQNKLSHGVPLDDLCRDLETYMSLLNKIILRHVNTDVHDAFVKVSGHLVGMQDDLRLVQHPVAVAVKKVEENIAKLNEMENTVTSQIAEATELELMRIFDVNFLKVLLLYDHLCVQLEALPPALLSPDDESSLRQRHFKDKPSRAVAVMASSEHLHEALQDISGLVQQLKSLKHMIPPLPQRGQEYAELDQILSSALQMVHRVLARAYLAVYEKCTLLPSDELEKSLLNIMLVYKAMDEVHEFCRMYRERILRPLLESVLSWRAATQARHSLVETINLLNTLRHRLEKDVLPFVSLLREAFGAELLPIPTVVCPIVFESLLKRMISLYDSGDPDAFQQRYVAAHEVLHLMKKNCVSDEELRALLRSPDVVLWEQRWNTDVYSAMRVNALTKRLGAAVSEFITLTSEQHAETIDGLQLREESNTESTVAKVVFRIGLFSRLRELIEWLFSPEVYIYVVTPKYLREVANVTRRVAKAIIEQSTATRTVSSLRDWLCVVMTACSDFTQLAEYLEGPFSRHICTVSQDTLTGPSCSQFLQLLVQGTCHGTVKQLHQLVQSRVVEACAVGLQNIRSVKSAYAHTRKPLPTAPSWYVTSIVEPIQRFAEELQRGLSPETWHEVIIDVVTDVLKMFRNIARDTLVTAKKTEESWGKLRRRKELTSSGGDARTGGMETTTQEGAFLSPSSPVTGTSANTRPTAETATDRDKMTLQLYLDAIALINNIEGLLESQCKGEESVRIRELPPVEAIHKLLQRAKWILGDDVREPPDIDEADE